MDEEQWVVIAEFPNYLISNYGDIQNSRTGRLMSISVTNHGHAKVSLVDDRGDRHTRSVAVLVATAFVEQKNPICDQVILLDGNLTNVRADNLAWRPRWFAWKYTQQLKNPIPQHYFTLPVENIDTKVVYKDIFEAGTTEGLLFSDIWRSTFSGLAVYPHRCRFSVSTKSVQDKLESMG